MNEHYHHREFHDILFMGNGQPHCTEARILKLKKILDNCLIEMGGLQQPTHSESEEMARQHEREYDLGKQKVRSMVKDIAMALTGQEIEFCGNPKEENYNYDKSKSIIINNFNILNMIDKAFNEPRVRRGLIYCKRIIDEAKKRLK